MITLTNELIDEAILACPREFEEFNVRFLHDGLSLNWYWQDKHKGLCSYGRRVSKKELTNAAEHEKYMSMIISLSARDMAEGLSE